MGAGAKMAEAPAETVADDDPGPPGLTHAVMSIVFRNAVISEGSVAIPLSAFPCMENELREYVRTGIYTRL